MNERVAVAGFEAVTSLANTWADTRRKLLDEEIGTSVETLHDQKTQVGRVSVEPSDDERIPRYHRLANRALVTFLEDRGSLPDSPLGIVASSSKGGTGKLDVRTVVSLHNPGIWAGRIASAFPQADKVSSPNTACATGLTALIQGARWIKHGDVDHALIITAESSFHPLLVAGYQNMKALCGRKGMRPFHPDRDGFALAEGAAVMYLQAEELRRKCDEKPLGYVESWGETADAHHMTQIEDSGRGLNDALNRTLNQANITREQIDVIHPHLTTTPSNDRVEKKIIEDWPDGVTLQGVKPTLGHSIGASGLTEAIATLDVLRHGESFPIANFDPDYFPVCNSTATDFRYGLTWNMGFGGQNASVLLKRD